MIIKLLVDGGEMKPGPVVGQQLGPIGINIGEVISEVNKATNLFKGIKVPIALNVDPKTKKFKIEIFSPPTSELLKKELGIEKGSGDHKKTKVANASIEQVIAVAKTKYPSMLSKEFKSAVKSIAGSCASVGALIENKNAIELIKDIESGLYDNEIKAQKTETSADKKKELKDFFDNVLKTQEAVKKAEEEAKVAEEAAKAVGAAAVAGVAAGAGEGVEAKKAPEAGEEAATAPKTEGAKPASAEKKEDKKSGKEKEKKK